MKENRGVQCDCGKYTPFSSWVYAHWDNVAEFTCPKCNKRYTIFQGKVKLEKLEFAKSSKGEENGR